MGYYIPDPRFEAPELFIPGVKPTGPVVVGFERPLARGLVSCYIFQEMSGNTVYDLARQRNIDIAGTSHSWTREGWASANPNSDSSYIEMGDLQVDQTMLIKYKPNNVSYGNDGVWDQSAHADDAETWIYTSGDWAARQNFASKIQVPGAVSGVGQSHAYAYNESGSGEVYIDGTSRGTKATGTISSRGFVRLSSGAGNQSGAGGVFEYAMHFARKLSATEVISLQRDPYQFLIPA